MSTCYGQAAKRHRPPSLQTLLKWITRRSTIRRRGSFEDGIQLIRQADGSPRHLFLEERLRSQQVRLAQLVAPGDDPGGIVQRAVGELGDLQALVGPVVDRSLGPLLDRLGLEMKKVVSGGPRSALAFPQADAGLPDTIPLN
jgi:hypothetical protein